jgi:hypothetical protein
MTTIHRMAGLVGGLVAALGGARAASACSCAPPPPAEESLGSAAVVFLGVAQPGDGSPAAIIDLLPGTRIPASRVRFEVSRRWKGDVTASFEVLTPQSCASCGRAYTFGTRYLVYASRQSDGAFIDYLCSRTRAADGAAEDLAFLGAGLEPLPGAGHAMSTSDGGCGMGGDGPAPGAWLGLACLALVRLAGRHRLRRRPPT